MTSMKQHYMSKIQTLNQQLENNKAQHQQRMMRSSSRSKSPISANLPRQTNNNNTFKIIGGGNGGSKVNTDSAIGIQRKMTSNAVHKTNKNFSIGDSSSSDSNGGSLSRDRIFDFTKGLQDNYSYRRVETMGNQSIVSGHSSFAGQQQKLTSKFDAPKPFDNAKHQIDGTSKYLNFQNLPRHSTMSSNNNQISNRSDSKPLIGNNNSF